MQAAISLLCKHLDAGPYNHNIKSATKSVGDVVLGVPFTLNHQPHPICTWYPERSGATVGVKNNDIKEGDRNVVFAFK